MLLVDAYKKNKMIAFFFALLMSIQLFITYKRGVIVSPFYNYGMYSAVSSKNNYFVTTEIYADQTMLRAHDLPIKAWSDLSTTIDAVLSTKPLNTRCYKLFSSYTGINRMSSFINDLSLAELKIRLRNKVIKKYKLDPHSDIKILKVRYQYINGNWNRLTVQSKYEL